MIKKNIIIFSVLFVAVAVSAFLLFPDKKNSEPIAEDNPVITGPIDISTITNEQIVSLLKTNPDSAGYVNKYKDFVITSETPLTKEIIEAGREGANFKEVYQDLELQDDRYMRVDLMNKEGNYGMITVLDLDTASVLKAYALLLMQTGVQQ